MGLLNRNQRLNGINPLSYLGVDAYQPSEFLTNTRAPTTSDNNFQLGAIWLYTNITVSPHTEDVYILVALDVGIAKWILFAGGSGDVVELTSDDGVVVLPDVNGNINTFGGTSVGGVATNINTIGGINTMSFALNNIVNLPNTDTAGTLGQFQFNSVRFMHNNGGSNTFLGANAGSLSAIIGVGNTGIGTNALAVLTSGVGNVAVGASSLVELTTGSNNYAIGIGALSNLLTGSFNIAVGQNAAINYAGAESSNIVIGAATTTVLGESNVLRIGEATGSGAGQTIKAFIQGIAGITTVVADAVPVLISASTSQLGTISSSIRFKDNVKDLGSISEDVLKLRPVVFNYKSHDAKAKQYGLIAEEVATIMPNLVVHDKAGDPTTVKYHDLPVLLLNELKKLQKRVDLLEHELKCYMNDRD